MSFLASIWIVMLTHVSSKLILFKIDLTFSNFLALKNRVFGCLHEARAFSVFRCAVQREVFGRSGFCRFLVCVVYAAECLAGTSPVARKRVACDFYL